MLQRGRSIPKEAVQSQGLCTALLLKGTPFGLCRTTTHLRLRLSSADNAYSARLKDLPFYPDFAQLNRFSKSKTPVQLPPQIPYLYRELLACPPQGLVAFLPTTMTDFRVRRWRITTRVLISKPGLVRSPKWHADRTVCFSRMGGGSADPAERSLEPPEGAVVLPMLPDLGVAARLCNSRFFQIEARSCSNTWQLFPAGTGLQTVWAILSFKNESCLLRERPLDECVLALQQLKKSHKISPAFEEFGFAAHFSSVDLLLKPCPERNPPCHPSMIHRRSLNLA